MSNRLMPDPMNLGNSYSTMVGHSIHNYKAWVSEGKPEDKWGRRRIMGFVLPEWQRGLRWTQEQSIRFIESIWKGIPIGTYSYNEGDLGSKNDLLLIDGQQRMWALQQYIEDVFPVFGYRYSEITRVDQRSLDTSRSFPCYITRAEDESYLKNYYNLMNFGGTPHAEDERA